MNYSEENAIALINEFFEKMYKWGSKVILMYKDENGGPQNNQELMRGELRIIYNDFLTKKERKTGRLEVMAVSIGSPDYNPAMEHVTEVQKKSGGFLIFTKKNYDGNNYFENYKYSVKNTTEGLRIDNKERFSDYENKWVKDVL